MRKSLAILFVLILVSGCGIYWANSTIGDEIDEVRFEENVIFGEKSVVEGVTVERNTKYSENMYWNTTYKVGEKPIVQTDFEFYEFEKGDMWQKQYSGVGFDIYNRTTVDSHAVWSGKSKDDAVGLGVAFIELLEETPNGTISYKNVYLKDYLDYYLFDVQIDLPDFFQIIENDGLEYQYSEEEASPYRELLDAFHTFFRIPVLENEEYRIGLKKDDKGQITDFAFASASGGMSVNNMDIEVLEYGDEFSFDVDAVYTEDTCYFTFDPTTWAGNIVDTSLIPGGYGVYSFQYNSEEGSIDTDSLKMVYPLEANGYVSLELDVQKENLIIFSEDKEQFYMTVVDLDTMEKKQHLAYAQMDVDELTRCYWVEDDFMVAQHSYHEAVLFSRNEDGTYKMEYTILDKTEELEADVDFLSGDCCFDWDGKRLLVSNGWMVSKPYWRETCGFYLAAFDESGLIYYGEYYSSLDTVEAEYEYSYCKPVNNNPLEVRWN